MTIALALTRPFVYLTIRHESPVIGRMNWVVPFATAAALVAAGSWAAPNVNLLHADGLVSNLLGFIQTMPGFYIAALAAVATFARESLDDTMPGTPPTATVIYNGQTSVQPLTRRRFLSLMFAYLTALSIGLTLLAIGGLSVAEHIRASLAAPAVEILRALFAFTFLAFTLQMLLITMWGLYYLGERIHTPDR